MKKRVLILVSRFLEGGIDTVLIEYLKQFDRNQYALTLGVGICMEELETHRHAVPSDIPVHYLVRNPALIRFRKKKVTGRLSFVGKLYDELFLSPVRRRQQRIRLRRLLKEHDVVIDFDSTFYSFLKRSPVPTVAFFHFSFSRYHRGNAKRLNRLGRKLDIYDRIVTICEEMRREGETMFPELRKKFVTIYNGLNFDEIKARAEEPITDERVSHPYILAVQRLEESQKDATTLLKAYKVLVDRYAIKERLYLAGEGKSRPMLEALVEELGLGERVSFLGKVMNPYPWIKRCELFVLSSKFEGFGIVLTEAMVLERALVSTACPTGPVEILAEGRAGSLVPVGDVEQMAEAIHKMLNDESYSAEMQAGMREHVGRFSVRRVMEQIDNLLTTLTDNR